MSRLTDFLSGTSSTELPCGLQSRQEKEVCNLVGFELTDDQRIVETSIKLPALQKFIPDNDDNQESINKVNQVLETYDGILELLGHNMGEKVEGTSSSLIFSANMEGGCNDNAHASIDFTCGNDKRYFDSENLDLMTPWLPVQFSDDADEPSSMLPFSDVFGNNLNTGNVKVYSCGIPANFDGESTEQFTILLNVYRKLIYTLKVKIPPVFHQSASLEEKSQLIGNKLTREVERSERLLTDKVEEKEKSERSWSDDGKKFKETHTYEREDSEGKVKYKGSTSLKNGIAKTSDAFEVKQDGETFKCKVVNSSSANEASSTVKTTYETGLIYAKQDTTTVEKRLTTSTGKPVEFGMAFRHREIGKQGLLKRFKSKVEEQEFVTEAAETVNDCIEFKINDKQPPEIKFVSALYNVQTDIKKFINELKGLVPAVGFKVSFDFTILDGTVTGEWGKRHDKQFMQYDHVRVVEDYWKIDFEATIFGFTLELFCGLDMELNNPKLLQYLYDVKTYFSLKAGVSISIDYKFKLSGKLSKDASETEYPNIISQTEISITSELKLLILDKFASAKLELKWSLGEKFFFQKKGTDGIDYFSVDGIKWFASKAELIAALDEFEMNIQGNTEKYSFEFDARKITLNKGVADPNKNEYPRIVGQIQPNESVIEFTADMNLKGTQDQNPDPLFKSVELTKKHKIPVWEGSLLG